MHRFHKNKDKYYAELQRKPLRIIVTSTKVYPHYLSRRHLDIPILNNAVVEHAFPAYG